MLLLFVSSTAILLLRTFLEAALLRVFISELLIVETGWCTRLLNEGPERSTSSVDACFAGAEDVMLLLFVSSTAILLLRTFVEAALLCVAVSTVFSVDKGVGRIGLLNEDPVGISVSCTETEDVMLLLFVSGIVIGLLRVFFEAVLLCLLMSAVFAVDEGGGCMALLTKDPAGPTVTGKTFVTRVEDTMLLLLFSDTGIGLPKRFVETALLDVLTSAFFTVFKEVGRTELLEEEPEWLTPGVSRSFTRAEAMFISGTAAALPIAFVEATLLSLLTSAILAVDRGVGRKESLKEDPVWLLPSDSGCFTRTEAVFIPCTVVGLFKAFVEATLLCLLVSAIFAVDGGVNRIEFCNEDPVWLIPSGSFARTESVFIPGTAVWLFKACVEAARLCMFTFAVFGVENGEGRMELCNDDPVWLIPSANGSFARTEAVFISRTAVWLSKEFVEATMLCLLISAIFVVEDGVGATALVNKDKPGPTFCCISDVLDEEILLSILAIFDGSEELARCITDAEYCLLLPLSTVIELLLTSEDFVDLNDRDRVILSCTPAPIFVLPVSEMDSRSVVLDPSVFTLTLFVVVLEDRA